MLPPCRLPSEKARLRRAAASSDCAARRMPAPRRAACTCFRCPGAHSLSLHCSWDQLHTRQHDAFRRLLPVERELAQLGPGSRVDACPASTCAATLSFTQGAVLWGAAFRRAFTRVQKSRCGRWLTTEFRCQIRLPLLPQLRSHRSGAVWSLEADVDAPAYATRPLDADPPRVAAARTPDSSQYLLEAAPRAVFVAQRVRTLHTRTRTCSSGPSPPRSDPGAVPASDAPVFRPCSPLAGRRGPSHPTRRARFACTSKMAISRWAPGNSFSRQPAVLCAAA